MYYRVSGGAFGELRRDELKARRKAALRELARGDPPPGLIGYRGTTPVGWISLGPREDYARLSRSPTMRAVNDAPVWSIVCFVVPSEYRCHGVARELLAGAVEYARQRGVRLLEAYPVDRSVPAATHAPWFGSKSMFDDAGFTEVARRKPARPIVRLAFDASSIVRSSCSVASLVSIRTSWATGSRSSNAATDSTCATIHPGASARWVTEASTRNAAIGSVLECRKCDEEE